MRTVLFLLAATAAGCSSASQQTDTPVTGKVTLDGTTVGMGEVRFENEAGTASGRGEIQPDGTYRVASAPVGKVKVAVRTSTYAQYAGTKRKGGKAITIGEREGTYVPVPKKYEDVKTSGLAFDVTPGAAIDIPLTSK